METSYQALLVLGACFTAWANPDGFYFFNGWFRRSGNEVCKVCYGDNDCVTLNQARCELYTATTEILAEDEGPQDLSKPELRTQVDLLMSSLVERVYTSPQWSECIPLISQYTDCTKENVCLGCMTCSCDGQGRWNCSKVQRCRPDEPLKVDHRALVFAMENLRGDGSPSFRLKRSVAAETPNKPHRISFEEVADWMYDIKHITLGTNETTEASTSADTTQTFNIDSLFKDVNDSFNAEPDYIAFDEVLKNIAIGNKSNSQNSSLSYNTINAHDYMDLEGVNETYNEVNQFEMTNDENGSTTTETLPTTKIVIDLLEFARQRIVTSSPDNLTATKDSLDKMTLENYTAFEDSNEIYSLNTVDMRKRSINIKKRELDQITTLDNEIISPDDTEKPINKTNIIDELHGGVYQPLNKIIRDKQQELEDLTKIREKLIEVIDYNRDESITVNVNKSETADITNSTHFSFYNVELIPDIEYAAKRSNVKELDNYLLKLKRDIFTVMKDVAIIQRISHRSVPDGMKGLIRAMRHYIHKHNKLLSGGKQRSIDEINDLRRHINEYKYENYFKKCLVEILQLIDQNMPQNGYALAPLSAKARKIVRTTIQNNKIDDFSALGLRINDPNYNLTNDLKTIGVNWQTMTIKIADSSPWDRLHHMKMLQLVLESDINKMNDALSLIDFAHSRRMISLNDDAVSQGELTRINTGLKSIQDKINKIIEYKKSNKKQELNKIVNFIKTDKDTKKESFLKHIRNLLRNSKKDIMNLLHKKVPKTEIIRELAKKKLDEITKSKLIEYENVMQKWQNNLNVNGRRKRSALGLEALKSRLANILPKYLRGKVNPKINSTRKISKSPNNKNNEKKKNKKSHSKRKRHHNNKRKNTTPTTFAIPTSSNNNDDPQ